ncbi:MAG: hypothetical protein MI702_11140, partial [Chlorobiales bacterium]|nr:hypothetical protein [Chlorobiales bacterium]
VRWPAKIKAGIVSEALVTSVDFYPTFLQLADVTPPAQQTLDGESLLPAWISNQYDPERTLFWHYPVYHHDVPAAAVRRGAWKLIQNQVSNEIRLYNLNIDIGESTDLRQLYPDKAEELKALLGKWQNEVGAEFPQANPAFDPTKRFEWGRHPDR